MPAILEFRNVSFAFGARTIFEDLSFSVILAGWWP